MHSSLVKATASGMVAAAEIDQVADYLAELMADIHNGDWRVSVRHDRRCIIIWDCGEDAAISPKREVA